MITEELLKSNTKFIGDYPIRNTDLKIPLAIINGKYTGKTLLITAGIHGSEYAGIEAAQRLIEQLQPETIQGRVIILPCCNPNAFYQRTAFVNPIDNLNFNRCFPGESEGSETQKIAYTLMQDFVSLADFYLDLHSGDSPEELVPLVFVPQVGSDEMTRQLQTASQYINVNYAVASHSDNGACGCAASNGTPALLIERGGLAKRDEVDILAFIQDVHNIMSYLEMTSSDLISYHQQFLTNIIYQDAPVDGLWYPSFKAGASVKKGALIGEIKNFFGQTIWQYYAQQDGIILYQWAILPITMEMPLVAYGK